ncbi:MAG: glycosyltransferase family 39 protein [Nitrospirae bacterium]|nr:glycosyltransferase family 39 protein [Nitrospirota bacterium]
MYINIAEKYLRGEFNDAINGYWGPLLSWLIIPFLYFGSSHVFAINTLDLIVGLLIITGVWFLSQRFEITEKMKSVILVAVLPVVLFILLIELFDALLLCLLIYYLGIIFKNEYPCKIRYAVFCGILGALSYFTKSFAFPFFIVHFIFFNIAHYMRNTIKEDKQKVLRNAVIGMAIFLIISSPWIFMISKKYDHFTISNMGKGNFANKAPGTPQTGYEFGGPAFHEGFFAPPNKTAISAWEDLSYIWEGRKSWSPLNSADNFIYFTKHCLKNIIDSLLIYQTYSRLSAAIVIAYILLLIVKPFSRQILRGDMLYPFFTLVLYTGGLVPFHFEVRYLWIANILLLLMGGYTVDLLFKSDFFNSNLRKNVLIVFFALSFMVTPLKSFIQAGKDNINKDMHVLGTTLKNKYNFKGNIASNKELQQVFVNDSWHKTFRIAYWLNSKYFGQARQGIRDEELESEFKKYDIDYYFFWGASESIPGFLYQYEEITGDDVPDLKIFSLKKRHIGLNNPK